MLKFRELPVWRKREYLEGKLAPWDVSVEEGCGEKLAIYLQGKTNLNEAFSLIPPEDFIEEATLIGTGVSDEGLEIFLSKERYALRSLVIRGSSVTGRGLDILRKCPELRRLIVECHVDSPQACEAIGTLISLESLALEAPDMILSDELTSLKRLNSVRKAEFVATVLGDGLRVVADLSSLELLYLNSKMLSDSDIFALKKADHLSSLTLLGGSISERGMSSLAELKSLRSLILGQCKLMGAWSSKLSRIVGLDELEFDEVHLTPQDISNIASLEIRRLSMCDYEYINDEMVVALSKCRNLKVLDIYCPLGEEQRRILRKGLPHIEF